MFRDIRIRNYKSLGDLHLSDLARFVLISGENNVGKTNLLEALFLFHFRPHPTMTVHHWASRGVPRVPSDTRSFLAPIFRNFDTKSVISIEAIRSEGTTESLSLRLDPDKFVTTTVAPTEDAAVSTTPSRPSIPPIIVTVRTDEAEQSCRVSFESSPTGELRVNVEGALPPTRAIFLNARGGMDVGQEAERFGEADRQRLIPDIVHDMQVIEPHLRGLSVIPMGGQNVIYADVGLEEKVPLRLSGDGSVRFLQYLLAIVFARNSVALFDEFDSGFHYTTKETLFKGIAAAARKYDCQVLCTTHSYECLQKAIKAFAENHEDDFCYVRLERTDSGVTAKHYTYHALAAAIENEWEVR